MCLCVLTARPHAGRAAGSGGAIARKVLRQLALSPGDRDVLEMLRASLSKVEDENDLGDLMVIYCLGCYYTGQSAKAEALKPIIVRKCPTSQNLKYLTTRFTRESCPACGTSGKRKSACADCGGGKRCSRCNGRGYRMMAGIGKQNKVNCAKCKSRGKCTTCSGQGTETKACGPCGGSGQRTAVAKVKAVYLALLKGERIDDSMFAATRLPGGRGNTSSGRADSTSTGLSTGVDDRPTSGDTQKQMDAYIDTMGALDKMFAERRVHETSLTELMALPERHKGRLLRSRGYILSCYPRELVVAPRSSAPRSDGTSLIPRSLEVGMKAVGLYEKIGKGKRVIVTYGIVSKDNRTLFDIEAL
jgi:hypothetical protein